MTKYQSNMETADWLASVKQAESEHRTVCHACNMPSLPICYAIPAVELYRRNLELLIFTNIPDPLLTINKIILQGGAKCRSYACRNDAGPFYCALSRKQTAVRKKRQGTCSAPSQSYEKYLRFLSYRLDFYYLSFTRVKSIFSWQFCNKSYTLIKILYWENNGFCLWQKRLEKTVFVGPKQLGKSWNYALISFAGYWMDLIRSPLKGIKNYHINQSNNELID